TLYVQDFKGNDPRFVYYLLKTISYRDYLDKAAVPGINRNDVHRAIVCLPPIHEQESIAATMHCLDIGIESHRAENETIEEIARAIFKSWFVDFDPVKAKAEGREPEGMDAATAALFPSDLVESQLGLVPAGWRVLTIADCTRVGRGASPRPINDYMDGDVPWIKIADATSGDGTFIFETKERVKQAGVSKSVEVVPGDLVMSNSASCGIPVFVEIYGCIHDGWLYFRDYQSITKHYLYYWLKNISAHLVHLADGSVQKNLNTTLVSSQPILVPPQPLMDHFDQVAVGLLVEMRNNIRLCRTLADLRNTLLPRLLSGKLHVPEAEAMVMEVVR
ncbi:MAG: restriction endonuclease subunit S, partial [Terracidiphilus sp.]